MLGRTILSADTARLASLQPRHRLLLRAAVAEPVAAREAWKEWEAATDITTADPEEISALAMLASRADLLAMGDASRARLHGLRRHSVARGLLVNRELQLATRALCAEGIAPVAIKGMALHRAYGAGRIRVVNDGDVLVPPGTLRQAVRVLSGRGFVPAYGLRPDDVECWAMRYHALPMARPGQPEVDLHWRLPHQPVATEAVVDTIAARAEATDFPWTIPHPAHQLAIAVTHGWPTISQAALRMLIDLAVLLEDPRVTAALVDEVIGPLRLRTAMATALRAVAAEGVGAAAELASAFARPRWSDRLWAGALTANNAGVGTRIVTAVAFHAPAELRSRPTTPLDPMAPPDPASSARFGLAGRGLWLHDGWATWTRGRLATLRVEAVPERAALSLGVSAAPGPRRRSLLLSGARLRVAHPVAGLTDDMVFPLSQHRPTTVRILSLRRAAPHTVVENGDHRRVGLALTRVCVRVTPGEGAHTA